MKATLRSTVHVVLRFVMLYKVVLTFDSVEDLDLRVWTFKKSYTEQLLSCGTAYYAVQGGSWNP